MAVLAVLAEGERYGLEVLEAVRRDGGLDISEGTIYPLLNRLRKEGKLSSRWVEDRDASHPRKYYRLTKEGEELLEAMRSVWIEHTRGMSRLVGEGARS